MVNKILLGGILATALALLFLIVFVSQMPQSTVSNAPNTAETETSERVVTRYSFSQVQQHGTEDSCWTTISGGVYDLTPYLQDHPGGKRDIMRICGIDGTEAFARQHDGERRPERTLDEFYIGDLM